jgi:hypothetical protein
MREDQQAITEPLLLLGTGSLLVIGAATLAIAALALWNARRSVELVEGRMERFRVDQSGLLAALREELRSLKEEWIREQEEQPGSQRQIEHLSQECLQLRQEKAQLAEELERERVKRQEAQQRVRQEREGRELESRARREAERRIDRYNRDLKEISQGIPQGIAQEENREARRQTPLPVLEGASDGKDLSAASYLTEKLLLAQRASQRSSSHEAEKPPRPVTPPKKKKKTASEPREGWPQEERPRLARWIPHPDDGGGASKEWASAGQERSQQRGQSDPQSDDPVEMFRRHYDKYLESYEGYLELIEMLHRMREGDKTKQPGSFQEHEWENRLRRANEGIKRTSIRLDALEEYHPELATDDRVSRRADLARRHSELERSGQGRTRT